MAELCAAGLDFVKDDELQGDGPSCPFEDRARAVAGYFVVAHLGFSAVPLVVGLAVDGLGAGLALALALGALLVSAVGLGLAVRRGEARSP